MHVQLEVAVAGPRGLPNALFLHTWVAAAAPVHEDRASKC